MNGKLVIKTIGKQNYNETDITRLVATISFNGSEKECWFDYPSEYGDYICDERIDAFVISLIPLAMRKEFDIESAVPISERLSYQLQNYYIPILSKYQKNFHKIELLCPCTADNLNTESAVGTGISCGIDSFYTVLKHINNNEENFRLTHLVTMNVGSFGFQGGDFSYNWFQKEIIKAKRVANELELPLIVINSNLMEIYQENHAYSGTFRMAGAILGIQKLFSKYYISAGFDIKDFDITSEENDDYDLFNLLVASNESTTFYSTGLEATRFERTQFITQYPVTYDNLTVCVFGNDNCGKCEKCVRTLSTLYALGELQNYGNSFDVNQFENHKIMNLSKARYYGIGYMRPLYNEIYMVLKKNNPLMYYLYSFIAMAIIYPAEKVKKIIKFLLPRKVKILLKNSFRKVFFGGGKKITSRLRR